MSIYLTSSSIHVMQVVIDQAQTPPVVCDHMYRHPMSRVITTYSQQEVVVRRQENQIVGHFTHWKGTCEGLRQPCRKISFCIWVHTPLSGSSVATGTCNSCNLLALCSHSLWLRSRWTEDSTPNLPSWLHLTYNVKKTFKCDRRICELTMQYNLNMGCFPLLSYIPHVPFQSGQWSVLEMNGHP